MTTMYQSVDDPEDIEQETAAERVRARRRLWLWIMVAMTVLALIVIFSGSRSNDQPDALIATQAERASYRTAISEPQVDLRRARLRDFETTYPTSELLPAVRTQLSVLDAHETKAWAVLSDAIYDPRADRVTKLAAIQIYEQSWGASYLGGRDDDIRALRETLEIDPEPTPDRELSGVNSPIPKSVPDTVMAGGPRAVPPPAPVRPYTPPPRAPVASTIIEPKIRKNRRPRYPRRAQKRGISAVVELSLSIDDKGEVRMAEVISVNADRYKKDFIKAAERAAMRTRYSPKTVNGKAVPTSGVLKRYVFKMN